MNLSHVQTHLSKQISKKPSNKRSKSLHGDWFLVKGFGISLETRDSSSPSDGRISEKRAQFGHILLSKRRLVGDKSRLAKSLGLGDDGGNAKGLSRKAGGDDNGAEELHGCWCWYFYEERSVRQMSASTAANQTAVDTKDTHIEVRGWPSRCVSLCAYSH